MSLRHALLGSLARQPRSGYDLVQQFTSSMGYVWTASQGAIYPELVRMEAEGLIETVETGARGRRTYGITDSGREALTAWLRTPPVRQAKDELVLRVFLLDHLSDDDAAAYFRDLQQEYADRLALYERRLADVPETGERADLFSRFTLRAGIAHETSLLAWARECEAELTARKPLQEASR